MTTASKTTVTLYVSKEVRDRAKAVADSRRRSLSEYVVQLIERDLRDIEARAAAKDADWAATMRPEGTK